MTWKLPFPTQATGDAGAAFRALLAACEDGDDSDVCGQYAVSIDFLGRVDLNAISLDHAMDLDRLLLACLSAHSLDATPPGAGGGGSAGGHAPRHAPKHVAVALQCAQTTLDLYGDFVASATRATVDGPVAIAREDRIRKCHDAKKLFRNIRNRVPAIRAKFANSRRVDDLAAKLEAKCDALF